MNQIPKSTFEVFFFLPECVSYNRGREKNIDKFTLFGKREKKKERKGFYTLNLSYSVGSCFLATSDGELYTRATSSTLELTYDLLRVDRLAIALIFFMLITLIWLICQIHTAII